MYTDRQWRRLTRVAIFIGGWGVLIVYLWVKDWQEDRAQAAAREANRMVLDSLVREPVPGQIYAFQAEHLKQNARNHYTHEKAKILAVSADSLILQVSSAFLLLSQAPDSIRRHFLNPSLPFDTLMLSQPDLRGLVHEEPVLIPPAEDSVEWMYLMRVLNLPASVQ
jgi:hypothetical protein